MNYSEHLEDLYSKTNLDSYPLLETELTAEDTEIWNHKLPSHLSDIGNLVLETRDAALMDKLTGV